MYFNFKCSNGCNGLFQQTWTSRTFLIIKTVEWVSRLEVYKDSLEQCWSSFISVMVGYAYSRGTLKEKSLYKSYTPCSIIYPRWKEDWKPIFVLAMVSNSKSWKDEKRIESQLVVCLHHSLAYYIARWKEDWK